jgi:uncharacterized protein
MSRNFVSDPQSVVKSGDVVRVKVLSVDIPRHRISLTLRLDDEGPRPAGSRQRSGGRPSGDSSRTGRGASPRSSATGSGPGPKAPDGTLADALRRAGLVRETPEIPETPKTPEIPKTGDDRPRRR